MDGCKGPYSSEGNLELKGEILQGSVAARAMPAMAVCVGGVTGDVTGDVTGHGWGLYHTFGHHLWFMPWLKLPRMFGFHEGAGPWLSSCGLSSVSLSPAAAWGRTFQWGSGGVSGAAPEFSANMSQSPG